MKIHKAKDNSMKLILAEPELFAEFIRDFIPLEILKDIEPGDIEDVTERLVSLLTEQKDGDTIKRIKLKSGTLFVIAIVEHYSQVNFRAPFKMLLYTVLILDYYEKEADKEASRMAGKDVKISLTKDFKYPPVLPIIFYDGNSEWTAETNFFNRTEMNGVFEKYVPKFEYELVNLNDYSFADIAEFGDVLSLFLIMDKLKTPKDLKELGKFPKKYIEQLDRLNIPLHLKELFVKVTNTLLEKINVPRNEIDDFMEQIDERGVSAMLTLENYDVQETRRLAREELREETKRLVEEERIRAEESDLRAEKERRRADTFELRLKSAIKSFLNKGYTLTEVSSHMDISEQEIKELLPELVQT